MKFQIDNFIVITEKKLEKLNEQIAVPTSINKGRTSEFQWQYKTREFTSFKQLEFFENKQQKYFKVIGNLFEFIDLIEILKVFNNNKLDTKREYKVGEVFVAKIVQKDQNISLKIHFKNYSDSLFLDKFEAMSLAAKFGKILQKCEAWQDQGV